MTTITCNLVTCKEAVEICRKNTPNCTIQLPVGILPMYGWDWVEKFTIIKDDNGNYYKLTDPDNCLKMY